MTVPTEVLAHYAEGAERSRLTEGNGRLELWRTQDILRRHLPPPPCRVLDVGGGPGVYAEWLAALGYQVHVVDPVPLHVEQAAALSGVTAQRGDARALTQSESSYDVVLALGPLYHLVERSDRIRAWREFARVVVPGGLVAAASISRFAALNDGLVKDWLLAEPMATLVEAHAVSGQHRNEANVPGLFTTAYFHHPDELAAEVVDAGLDLVNIVGVEVTGWLVGGLPLMLDDPARRTVLLRWLRLIEAEPSLAGASAHQLTLARRRASAVRRVEPTRPER